MLKSKKVVVVLPAYNAAATLELTYNQIPHEIVDEIVLVDDNSLDNTIEIAKRLGIKHIIKHDKNLGYGANQKTCYTKALALNADIIVMLHPDYQYNPQLIPAMIDPIGRRIFDVVLGSRILGLKTLKGGMPVYKYIFNRLLTFIQNILLNEKLSEYHTGYRAFSADVLRSINFINNSNDFVFDNQFLAQILYKHYMVGEISCPAKYTSASSSINFTRSLVYGIGVLKVSLTYRLNKMNVLKSALFSSRSKPKSKIII